MRKARKTFFIILGILFAIELSLRAAGLFILAKNKKNPPLLATDSQAIRIMFVGDSWTFGSDARPGKGYVDIFAKLLQDKFPRQKIQVFNYGFPSSNSAQCLYQFTDHLKELRPHILVVLAGVNNTWNTVDVERARRRIDYLLGIGERNSREDIKMRILNEFKKLRIVKLIHLTIYNFFNKEKENKFTYFALIDGSSYAREMHTLFCEEGSEAARRHLVNNRKEAKDYDAFFRLVFYTFNHDLEQTKEFLKSMNLYYPQLLKSGFEKEFRKQQKFMNLSGELLLEHLNYLKLICDKNNILLLVQTYPFSIVDYHEYVNEAIRDSCRENRIFCIDHARYFFSKFSQKELRTMFNKIHPNDKGHLKMGENLFRFFSERNILARVIPDNGYQNK